MTNPVENDRRPSIESSEHASRKPTLQISWGTRVIDSYERKDKTSRDYPRKKKEKPPGKPKILLASAFQKRQAAIVKKEQMQLRLTA